MSKKAIDKLSEYLSTNRSDDQIVDYVSDLANSNDPTMRTIASRFSLMKKYVRDNHPKYSDDVLRKLAPPRELTQSIIDSDRLVRNAKQDVRFDQDLVDTILGLKNSPSVFERFVYLQFVSGRRISEIFESEYKAVPKKNRLLKMQLSKKHDNKFYNVELMNDVTSAEFRKMLTAARKAVTGMSLSDFTSRINRVVRKVVRKDLTSHSLRGLYGVYRYHTDNPGKQNLVGYISRVLNHGATSESGVNYANYSFEE
jgi:hypothetical protein